MERPVLFAKSTSGAGATLLLALFFLFFSRPAASLTNGPTPPEVQGFAPAEQQDLVELFSGDFQYSIGLLEVPGPGGSYPIGLSYRSGISMEQEASWVGLGWTLNPGSITRQMRGLPDDFDATKGDRVITRRDVRPNQTFGLGLDGDIEIYAADPSVGLGLSAGFKAYYKPYPGF